jgi:hypothetical protein
MSYTRIIIIASHIPILAAALLSALLYKRLQQTGKLFAWFICFSCIIQLTSLGYWFMRWNNMPLLHLFVPIRYGLLALFYGRLLSGYINVKIIYASIPVFIVFSLANSVFIQPIHSFNSVALTVEGILLLILSIFTFIVHLNVSSLPDEKSSWAGVSQLNSGIFIYYASTLLLFYFGSSVMRLYSIKLSAYVWMFHSFFSVVMYICFIIGIWKQATYRS